MVLHAPCELRPLLEQGLADVHHDFQSDDLRRGIEIAEPIGRLLGPDYLDQLPRRVSPSEISADTTSTAYAGCWPTGSTAGAEAHAACKILGKPLTASPATQPAMDTAPLSIMSHGWM